MRELQIRHLPEISRKCIWVVFAMLQVARMQWQFNSIAWLTKPLVMVALVAVGSALQRKISQRSLHAVLWVVLAVSSVLMEYVARWAGCGEPLELVLLELFWAVGVCSSLNPGEVASRVTALVSVFMAAFLFFIDPSFPVAIAGFVFFMTVVFSLLRAYWIRIEAADVDQVSASGMRRGWFVPILFLIVVVGVGSIFPRIPAVAKISSRLSPFSGGEAWADAFAISGIGDGEALVAATKAAQTEGPVDSDVFIESKKRSLYDVVSDEYGKAKKPMKNQDRNFAVSLTAEKMQKNHQKLAQAQKNSATFTLCRQTSGKREIPGDLTSDALFLVDSQGPMLMKMQTFDHFDGIQWTEQTQRRQKFFGLMNPDDNDWYCLKRMQDSNVLRSLHSIGVSIIHLKSSEVPTPPLLEAWSIKQINRHEFYSYSNDQLVMKVGNDIPEFTQISLVKHGFKRPADLDDTCFTFQRENDGADQGCQLFREQANRLVQDLPQRSWQRVEKIKDYMVEHFQLQSRLPKTDASSSFTSLESESPLLDFWNSKVGEDYKFATAASVMLRECGLNTRLAQGFYVAPKSYDPRTRKSSVYSRDMHTWVELEVEPGVWLPLETTPGYESIPDSLTLLDCGVELAKQLLLWTTRHPVTSILILAGIGCLGLLRKRIVSLGRLVEWRVKTFLLPNHAVAWTLRWSEHRLAGIVKRQQHEPLGGWIHRVSSEFELSNDLCSAFVRSVNLELYSNNANQALEAKERMRVCQAWVKSLWDLQDTARPRALKSREVSSYENPVVGVTL